MIPLPVDMSFH